MRAVSLSDERVINVLNRSFVSVFTSNEDYRVNGSAPPDERAILTRIHQEGLKKGLSVGSVHVYVLSPDGEVLDSLHTAEAAKVDRLLPMLNKAASRHPQPVGEPTRVLPSIHRSTKAGELVLGVTARYLERRGDALALVENAGGNWSALPGEDTLTLTSAESARLFSTSNPGSNVDKSLLERILRHFYPPTENNDLSKNRFEFVNVTVDKRLKDGTNTRVLFHGDFRMEHPFYHRDDDWAAAATFYGYCDVDSATNRISRLRIATESATYASGSSNLPFGVVVRELP